MDGRSEEIIGRWLTARPGVRDSVVIATKGRYPAGPGPNGLGLSRQHLSRALDGSLRRLQVDTIDLYQLHGWDPLTGVEETLRFLDDAVRAGKINYVGLSNFTAWQIQKYVDLAEAGGLSSGPVAVQPQYNLLARAIEWEIIPACQAAGLGLLPWSPLGRGVLTGKYRSGVPADSRAASAVFAPFVEPYLDGPSDGIVDAVMIASDGLGVAPLEVALAWVRDRAGVTAPIVGARTVAQLRGCLSAEQLTLPREIREALDDVSEPEIGYPEHTWQPARPRLVNQHSHNQ